MKRLICFDMDGTLLNTFSPEEGKPMWEKHYNKIFPYKGWWGRRESLDTDVFDIKPFPKILAQLKKDQATPDTYVIILTSRMEKLRPEVENILNLNNIVVDDVILKRGGEDKGDIILRIENYNDDLQEIIVYDDFMNGNSEKIAEYRKIENLLSDNIQYHLYIVNNDRISLLESTDILKTIINEEIQKIRL